jgi:hypothetical protein
MATKTETLSIKVAPEEKEQIKHEAAAADMTVSKYLHRLIFTEKELQENDKQANR